MVDFVTRWMTWGKASKGTIFLIFGLSHACGRCALGKWESAEALLHLLLCAVEQSLYDEGMWSMAWLAPSHMMHMQGPSHAIWLYGQLTPPELVAASMQFITDSAKLARGPQARPEMGAGGGGGRRSCGRPSPWPGRTSLSGAESSGLDEPWEARVCVDLSRPKEVASFDGLSCARCEKMLGRCNKHWFCVFCLARSYLHVCRTHAHWSDNTYVAIIRWAMGTTRHISGTATGLFVLLAFLIIMIMNNHLFCFNFCTPWPGDLWSY